MSWNSAPPRRSLNTSLTLFVTSALVDFMRANLLLNPCGVPIVKTEVINRGHLLHVFVRPQVCGPFPHEAQAVRKRQASDLGMAARRGHRLTAVFHQFLDGA